jgi:phospholipid/cholesterol/gamma-HCH transport system substrate-binding protein
MDASRTTQFIAGILGLIGIAGLSVLAFTVGRIPLAAPPSYRLYAMFDDVSGLKVNDAVQIAGVKVGKVAAITLSQKNERARVTLQIDKDVMVDDEAIASIKTSGIIGDKYVSISLGGGEPLKDGGVITHTESSFVLEDAIRQLVGGNGGKSAGGDNNQSSPTASPTPGDHKSSNSVDAPPGVGSSKNQENPDNKGRR